MSTATMEVTRPARATALPRAEPDAAEYLCAVERVDAIYDDWLYQNASPAGRAKILREHGLYAAIPA